MYEQLISLLEKWSIIYGYRSIRASDTICKRYILKNYWISYKIHIVQKKLQDTHLAHTQSFQETAVIPSKISQETKRTLKF